MLRQIEWVNLAISSIAILVSIVFALLALRDAKRARRDAQKANRISSKSNEIAQESNRIAHDARIGLEEWEHRKFDADHAAIVKVEPSRLERSSANAIAGYFPFEFVNIGRARANGVRVRWWMMYALDRDSMLQFLLSDSYMLGDIRADDYASRKLYLYLPPTSGSIDVRIQLSWDDNVGSLYHHSEFVYWFSNTKDESCRVPQPYFVGANLDSQIHPTYKSRIERQKSGENFEKLTAALSRSGTPNAPSEWTRIVQQL